MASPIEQQAGLVIGTVESVSPQKITVLLNTEAPQATALNTGTPTSFPRINGYLLIPIQTGAVVGQITWIGVEKSAFPKRTGFKDFGIVDLPYPLRKLLLTPIGSLSTARHGADGDDRYDFERGISVFPSVGDSALLPSPTQLRVILETSVTRARLVIGRSPLVSDARIAVDPDRLFGRHLAVLGNTGSGKSCTVAGLIRWSLQAAAANLCDLETPNARFLILDSNGEYADAFTDLGGALRVFRPPPVEGPERTLTVPTWMWNLEEWSAFASAAPRVQQPLLLRSLRDLRAGRALDDPLDLRTTRQVKCWRTRGAALVAQGTTAYADSHRARFDCARFLEALVDDARALSAEYDDGADVRTGLEALANQADGVVDARRSGDYFDPFRLADLSSVLDAADVVLSHLPDLPDAGGPSPDSPIEFDVSGLPNHLESIAASDSPAAAQFVSFLSMRIRTMLADRRLSGIVAPDTSPTFATWLEDHVGANNAANGQIAVLDLSLVPSDVLHVVIGVVARVVFEATQRYRQRHKEILPTVLVLEEAHNFIQRGTDDPNEAPSATRLCRRVFERIAREGRKFGLGLVLSSQRPSELSPTVLAQCNTFLLHRIVNDRDQQLVSRLVPDALGEILADLPSLPSRQAILLGWASQIPKLVEILELPEQHRPRSADPDFWDVWSGHKTRPIDWVPIVQDWTA